MIKRVLTLATVVSAFFLGGILFSLSTSFTQEHIRVGYFAVTGHAKFFIAKEKGF
jgi:ABC-type nitrate/sulfonate/bicarbonate transport system substrate-binding protein